MRRLLLGHHLEVGDEPGAQLGAVQEAVAVLVVVLLEARLLGQVELGLGLVEDVAQELFQVDAPVLVGVLFGQRVLKAQRSSSRARTDPDQRVVHVLVVLGVLEGAELGLGQVVVLVQVGGREVDPVLGQQLGVLRVQALGVVGAERLVHVLGPGDLSVVV